MRTIRITEKCTHKESKKEYDGVRVTTYKTYKDTLLEALHEYEEFYVKSQIINIKDNFEANYCYGEIIKVELA